MAEAGGFTVFPDGAVLLLPCLVIHACIVSDFYLFLYSFRSFFSNSSHTLKGVNFLAGCFVKPAGQHCADWGYNKHRYITIRGIVSVRRVNFGNA